MSAPPCWAELIRPDRVHGSLYTDPAIFEAELERIWYRTWVYVGHVSEVANPNDFVQKWIGPQSVIMSRDREGVPGPNEEFAARFGSMRARRVAEHVDLKAHCSSIR